MFRLLRYFSIASLLALAAVTVLLAFFYRHTAVQALIEQEESKNVAVTRVFANSVRQELASHLMLSEGLSVAELRALPSVALLQRTIAAEKAGLAVAKIKIYNAAGVTIFSTEASQIGEDKGANAGFQAARAGAVGSELTHRDTFSSFDGVLEDQDVLSTYLPVRLAGPTGEVAGVFELYSNVTPLLRRIDATERTLIIGAAAILLLLYAVLFLIVRHADAILRRQHEEQQQSDATLRRQQLALAAARERERLARDLHDSIGQVLGYVNIQAQAASALVTKGQASDAHRLIQRLVEVVQQAHVDVREQIHMLQEGPVLHSDPAAALDNQVAQFRRRSHVETELINVEALQQSAITRATAAQLIGIVQEALANIHKHAQAQHAWVRFAAGDEHLQVTVMDDGAGFAHDPLAQQGGRHFGLQMMHARAVEIGAALQVLSAPGRGTQIEVKVPLAQRPQAKEVPA